MNGIFQNKARQSLSGIFFNPPIPTERNIEWVAKKGGLSQSSPISRAYISLFSVLMHWESRALRLRFKKMTGGGGGGDLNKGDKLDALRCPLRAAGFIKPLKQPGETPSQNYCILPTGIGEGGGAWLHGSRVFRCLLD